MRAIPANNVKASMPVPSNSYLQEPSISVCTRCCSISSISFAAASAATEVWLAVIFQKW